jgi:hypothetical protein
MSGEYLTMAEIETKYPNEWVLIDKPKVDRERKLLGGYVLAHSSDRNDVERRVETLPRPFHIATHYTGPDDEDVVFCL